MSKLQSDSEPADISAEEKSSIVFAQMVVQQSNLAMMLLGKMPHPQTGKTVQDLEGARMFIDQLEMLETKTKGNLSPEEQALLKQSLMSLRMAFVQAVEPQSPVEPATASEKTESSGASVATDSQAAPAGEAAGSDVDSKKKFSKKY